MPRRTPVRELQSEESSDGSLRRSSRIAQNSPGPANITQRRNSGSNNDIPAKIKTKRLSLSQESSLDSTEHKTSPDSNSTNLLKRSRLTRSASKSPTALAKETDKKPAPVKTRGRRGSLSKTIEETKVDSPAPLSSRRRSTRSESVSPTSQKDEEPAKPRTRRGSITEKINQLEKIEEGETTTTEPKRHYRGRKISISEMSELHVIEETEVEKKQVEKQDLVSISEATETDDNDKASTSNVKQSEKITNDDKFKLSPVVRLEKSKTIAGLTALPNPEKNENVDKSEVKLIEKELENDEIQTNKETEKDELSESAPVDEDLKEKKTDSTIEKKLTESNDVELSQTSINKDELNTISENNVVETVQDKRKSENTEVLTGSTKEESRETADKTISSPAQNKSEISSGKEMETVPAIDQINKKSATSSEKQQSTTGTSDFKTTTTTKLAVEDEIILKYIDKVLSPEKIENVVVSALSTDIKSKKSIEPPNEVLSKPKDLELSEKDPVDEEIDIGKLEIENSISCGDKSLDDVHPKTPSKTNELPNENVKTVILSQTLKESPKKKESNINNRGQETITGEKQEHKSKKLSLSTGEALVFDSDSDKEENKLALKTSPLKDFNKSLSNIHSNQLEMVLGSDDSFHLNLSLLTVESVSDNENLSTPNAEKSTSTLNISGGSDKENKEIPLPPQETTPKSRGSCERKIVLINESLKETEQSPKNDSICEPMDVDDPPLTYREITANTVKESLDSEENLSPPNESIAKTTDFCSTPEKTSPKTIPSPGRDVKSAEQSGNSITATDNTIKDDAIISTTTIDVSLIETSIASVTIKTTETENILEQNSEKTNIVESNLENSNNVDATNECSEIEKNSGEIEENLKTLAEANESFNESLPENATFNKEKCPSPVFSINDSDISNEQNDSPNEEKTNQKKVVNLSDTYDKEELDEQNYVSKETDKEIVETQEGKECTATSENSIKPEEKNKQLNTSQINVDDTSVIASKSPEKKRSSLQKPAHNKKMSQFQSSPRESTDLEQAIVIEVHREGTTRNRNSIGKTKKSPGKRSKRENDDEINDVLDTSNKFSKLKGNRIKLHTVDIETKDRSRKSSGVEKSPGGKKKKEKSHSDEELLEKVSGLLESVVEDISSSSENEQEMNEFIDDMAEEGEEDTPSEGSNDIICEGESINSSDTYTEDDDDVYEDDSFIDDDEEKRELLSGEEDFLQNISPEKLKKAGSKKSTNPVKTSKKRKRIITPSESEDEIQKEDITEKEVDETCNEMQNVEPNEELIKCICAPESSEIEKEAAIEEPIIEPGGQIKEPTENETNIPTDLMPSRNDVITVDSDSDSELSLSDNESDKPQNDINSSSLENKSKRKSSITIQENIKLEDIQDGELSDRISKVVDWFYSGIKGSCDTGNISLNVSLDYADQSQSGENTAKGDDILIIPEIAVKKSAKRKSDETIEIRSPKKGSYDHLVDEVFVTITDSEGSIEPSKRLKKSKRKSSQKQFQADSRATSEASIDEEIPGDQKASKKRTPKLKTKADNYLENPSVTVGSKRLSNESIPHPSPKRGKLETDFIIEDMPVDKPKKKKSKNVEDIECTDTIKENIEDLEIDYVRDKSKKKKKHHRKQKLSDTGMLEIEIKENVENLEIDYGGDKSKKQKKHQRKQKLADTGIEDVSKIRTKKTKSTNVRTDVITDDSTESRNKARKPRKTSFSDGDNNMADNFSCTSTEKDYNLSTFKTNTEEFNVEIENVKVHKNKKRLRETKKTDNIPCSSGILKQYISSISASKREVDENPGKEVKLKGKLSQKLLPTRKASLDDSWESEVFDVSLHPSLSNKKLVNVNESKKKKTDLDSFGSKDFKNRMLYDSKRVKRMDTRALLRQHKKV